MGKSGKEVGGVRAVAGAEVGHRDSRVDRRRRGGRGVGGDGCGSGDREMEVEEAEKETEKLADEAVMEE